MFLNYRRFYLTNTPNYVYLKIALTMIITKGRAEIIHLFIKSTVIHKKQKEATINNERGKFFFNSAGLNITTIFVLVVVSTQHLRPFT